MKCSKLKSLQTQHDVCTRHHQTWLPGIGFQTSLQGLVGSIGKARSMTSTIDCYLVSGVHDKTFYSKHSEVKIIIMKDKNRPSAATILIIEKYIYQHI